MFCRRSPQTYLIRLIDEYRWRQRHPRDPELARELGVDQLPALSMVNARELLRAAMPLPQLTVEAATDLVIKQLFNRTRSQKSRLKTLGHKHSPT
jgi:hypothetical protein